MRPRIPWSGILFWIAAGAFALLILPASCSVPLISDMLAADKERAAASRASAEALAAMAEAEKTEADAAKVVADANAYTVKRYTDAGVAAIETDRKQAHKMIWFAEVFLGWLAWAPLCCCLPLNLACLGTVLALWRKRSKPLDTNTQ